MTALGIAVSVIHMNAARRSALHISTTRKLDRLANSLPPNADLETFARINAKAIPLRVAIQILDLAFRGWSLREIEDEIGRGLTALEVSAAGEECAAAAAHRRALVEAADREQARRALERAEEAAWLAAMG